MNHPVKTEWINIHHHTLRHDEFGYPTINWTGDRGSSGEFRLSEERAADLDSIDVDAAVQAHIHRMNTEEIDGAEPADERWHYVLA